MPNLSDLDPSASLVESLTPNAKIVPDVTGMHFRVVWLGDEKSRVQQYLGRQLEKAIEDYKPAWNKRAMNIAAYEALSDKGDAITLPFSRSQANQQHAWLMERVFSADPLISIRPLGDSTFDIVVLQKDQQGNVVGAEPKTISSSDEAEDIQDLIQFKWTVRLKMREVLSDWALGAIIDGTCPSVVKMVHDEQKRRIGQFAMPKIASGPDGPLKSPEGQKTLIINAPEFKTVIDGETVRPIVVPGDDFILPFGYTDIQKAPWCAMHTEQSVSDARMKMSGDEPTWDFCLDEGSEVPEELIHGVLAAKDTSEEPNKRGRKAVARVDKRRSIDPMQMLDIYEIPFRWPILQENNPNLIEWQECVADFHLDSKTMLSCSLLDTWNGKRPFLDLFMRRRPNSYSGTCTVEDVAPFQRYASNLFHLQVQNMVMRNISVIIVRKGTTTATFLSSRPNIKPGMVLKVDEMEDVKMTPLGTPIESIANEITFLKNGAVEMGLSTQYDNATADLSRVTAGAFAQQQDLSKMQPKQVYAVFAERISELALMYIQFLIQYTPEQTIPSFDPETDAVIQRVIRLPRQMVTDQFQFTVTATSSDQTPESQFQQDLVLSQQVMGANNFAMSVLGQIMQPEVPIEFSTIGTFLIQRSELMLKSMFNNARRHDVSKFAMKPEMIQQAIQSLAMKAAVAQAAGGAGGAVPNAGGGGGVPANPGQQQGLPAVPQGPGGAGMGAPNQGGNLPTRPATNQ